MGFKDGPIGSRSGDLYRNGGSNENLGTRSGRRKGGGSHTSTLVRRAEVRSIVQSLEFLWARRHEWVGGEKSVFRKRTWMSQKRMSYKLQLWRGWERNWTALTPSVTFVPVAEDKIWIFNENSVFMSRFNPVIFSCEKGRQFS